MKTEKHDVDVDFIGGQGSLTKAEEKALSDFFKLQKSIAKKNHKVKNDAPKKVNIGA